MREFYADGPAAWRNWLAEHHMHADHVWLELFKKGSGIPTLSVDEAIDEALCFGWVDSKPRKKDDRSYFLYFSPRSSKSNWSQVNKDRVARLQADGKMAPRGLELVRIAQSTGTWDALHDVDHLVIHADLAAALDAFAPARAHWEAFPRSVKRGILEWIYGAKRPATRAKRIDETARLAQVNKRANQFPRETL